MSRKSSFYPFVLHLICISRCDPIRGSGSDDQTGLLGVGRRQPKKGHKGNGERLSCHGKIVGFKMND